jgi:hypothetical protein
VVIAPQIIFTPGKPGQLLTVEVDLLASSWPPPEAMKW